MLLLAKYSSRNNCGSRFIVLKSENAKWALNSVILDTRIANLKPYENMRRLPTLQGLEWCNKKQALEAETPRGFARAKRGKVSCVTSRIHFSDVTDKVRENQNTSTKEEEAVLPATRCMFTYYSLCPLFSLKSFVKSGSFRSDTRSWRATASPSSSSISVLPVSSVSSCHATAIRSLLTIVLLRI